MFIKNIKIQNFKTFKDIDIKLSNLNILIGANASGKSNFISLFRFIRDMSHGLYDAISLQGGTEYIRNIGLSKEQNLFVEIDIDDAIPLFLSMKKNEMSVIYDCKYSILINFNKKGSGFSVLKEELHQKLVLYDSSKRSEIIEFISRTNKKSIEKNKLKEIDIKYVRNKNGEILLDYPEEYSEYLSPLKYRVTSRYPKKLDKNTTLLENTRSNFLLPIPIANDLKFISIFDFDPNITKKATPITVKEDLEEDGSNLPIRLRKILLDKDNKRKLSNLLSDFLPFIHDISTEQLGKTVIYKIKEEFCLDKFLPPFTISDGTVNIIALIVALYFQTERRETLPTIIEEPERNIHPHLISKLVRMMKDAATNKQIIVTTHNPELIRNADLEDILLITRDNNGFSTIKRPFESNEIKTFLKNDIGIDTLYIENLLNY